MTEGEPNRDDMTHEERQTALMEQMVKELGDIKAAIYGVIIVWIVAGIFVFVTLKEASESGF